MRNYIDIQIPEKQSPLLSQYESNLNFNSLHVNKIQHLLEPLKDYGINYFEYNKIYWNGSYFKLCNRQDVIDYRLKFPPPKQVFKDMPIPVGQKLIFLDEIDKQSDYYQHCVQPLCEQFNITSGVALLLYSMGSVSIYFFGAPSFVKNFDRNLVKDLYIFEQFSNYFQEQAHDILLEAKSNRIEISQTNHDFLMIKDAWINYWQDKKATLYDKLTPTKLYLHADQYNKTYLTKREAECLRLIYRSFSYQQIADLLDLSLRTVHKHAETLMIKLRCRTRQELTDLRDYLNIFEHQHCSPTQKNLFEKFAENIKNGSDIEM